MKKKTYKRAWFVLASVAGITLSACGGGGGGGGDTAPAPGNESTDQDQTTEEYAPNALSAGMTFRLDHDGKVHMYSVTSDTECVDSSNGKIYNMEYTRTGAKAATLRLSQPDEPPLTYTLSFTQPLQGTTQLDNGSIISHGTISITENTTNSGTPDTPEDSGSEEPAPGYAPATLPTEQFLVIKDSSGADIAFKLLSANSAMLNNETGTISYEVNSPNSATFKFTSASATYQFSLEFASDASGMASNQATGTQTAFTIGEYTAPVPPPAEDDDDESTEESQPDNNSGSANTPAPPPAPVYLAPEGLKHYKFKGYGSEYYYFIQDGAMEYSDGYTLFTRASCTYERTGYTTGTLTFRNAWSYTGTPYLRTEKTRESSGTINLTFYKGSDNRLNVRMQGYVRETTRKEDLTKWPAKITTDYRTLSISGNYTVE